MTDRGDQTLCPSAAPEMRGSRLLGVVLGNAGEPRVAYLRESYVIDISCLKLPEEVSPAQVFRFAAPCAGDRCRHFDGSTCTLARRIVESLPVVTEDLPICWARPSCRWWLQEGREACVRCPEIATESYGSGRRTQLLQVVSGQR